jgi:hypothetical protein
VLLKMIPQPAARAPGSGMLLVCSALLMVVLAAVEGVKVPPLKNQITPATSFVAFKNTSVLYMTDLKKQVGESNSTLQ